jgi:hypothetical protein
MRLRYTLKKTIPSSSHNSPCNEELGHHWPAGQQFYLLPKSKQNYFGKTAFEQIGGEEVIVVIPTPKVEEFFGKKV